MSYKNNVVELIKSNIGEGRTALAELHAPGDGVQAPFHGSNEDSAYHWEMLMAAGGGEPAKGQTNQQEGSLESSPPVAYKKGTAGEHSDCPEALVLEAIRRFSAYLKEERERYRSQGRILTEKERALFQRFFSHELLNQVRVVELSGKRLENPPFYLEAMMLGLTHLPHMTHKASATFLDVIVFNEPITDRAMFHALVHAAQVHVLGERFFSELFAREVLRVRSYSLVPMKAQAFALDARFAAHPDRPFSVEAEIRAWLNEGRY